MFVLLRTKMNRFEFKDFCGVGVSRLCGEVSDVFL